MCVLILGFEVVQGGADMGSGASGDRVGGLAGGGADLLGLGVGGGGDPFGLGVGGGKGLAGLVLHLAGLGRRRCRGQVVGNIGLDGLSDVGEPWADVALRADGFGQLAKD